MHYAPLSPTVAEEPANPEGEKGEPDGWRDDEVVEAELAGVHVLHVVRPVVHVGRVGRHVRTSRLVGNTNACPKKKLVFLIRKILKFWGLKDPDPLDRVTDPNSDPSIIKQK